MGTRNATFIKSKKYAERIRKNIIKNKIKNNIKEENIKEEKLQRSEAELEENIKEEKLQRSGPAQRWRSEAETVIFAQYGQYDGYPSEAGRVIADFVRDIATEKEVEKFIEKLEAVKQYEEFDDPTPMDNLDHFCDEKGKPVHSMRGDRYEYCSRFFPEMSRKGAYMLGAIHRGRKWFVDATNRHLGAYVENATRAEAIAQAIKNEASWATERLSEEEKLEREKEEKEKKEKEEKQIATLPEKIECMYYHNLPLGKCDVEWSYVIDLDERTVLVIWHCGSMAPVKMDEPSWNFPDLSKTCKACKLFTFKEFMQLPMSAVEKAFHLSDDILRHGGMTDELLSYCINPKGDTEKSNFSLQQSAYSFTLAKQHIKDSLN